MWDMKLELPCENDESKSGHSSSSNQAITPSALDLQHLSQQKWLAGEQELAGKSEAGQRCCCVCPGETLFRLLPSLRAQNYEAEVDDLMARKMTYEPICHSNLTCTNEGVCRCINSSPLCNETGGIAMRSRTFRRGLYRAGDNVKYSEDGPNESHCKIPS